MNRKLFYALLLAVLPLLSMAQKVRYGASAAIVGANPVGYSTHWGFQAGATGDFVLTSIGYDELRLHPSLLLSNKGWRDEFVSPVSGSHKWDCSLYYIELPVMVEYALKLRGKSSLVIGAGPFMAYGLWGSNKIDVDGSTLYDKDTFSAGNYRRFDTGLKASVGIDVKQWQVSLEYGHSLMKPTKNDLVYLSPKNRTLALKLTYMIGTF
mgnify:CR=1 FL=1